MDYGNYRHLIVEVEGGIAVVTINRPEVFNARTTSSTGS